MSNDARFPPDTYGMLSRHGMRPGMDGPVNKINQDRAALCQHPHDSSVVVAAVFDGHGHNGGEASHFVIHRSCHSITRTSIADEQSNPCA